MTILRDITNAKHREVERLPLIQTIMQGKITKEQYVGYLFELVHIYEELENCAERVSLMEDLRGIERTNKLKADLKELDENYSRVLTPATLKYLKYLHNLSLDQDRKQLIMAHVYV